MLFALALGAILGFFALDPLPALAVLAAALVGKGIFEVRYCHLTVLDRPSPFLHYCKNLLEQDEDVSNAGFSYLLQLVIFGLLAGGGIYALVRLLRG
jgi:hypothetical protein